MLLAVQMRLHHADTAERGEALTQLERAVYRISPHCWLRGTSCRPELISGRCQPLMDTRLTALPGAVQKINSRSLPL